MSDELHSEFLKARAEQRGLLRSPLFPFSRLPLDVCRADLVLVTVHTVFCFSSLVAYTFPTCQLRGGRAVLGPGLSLPPEARALWLSPGLRARRERGHRPACVSSERAPSASLLPAQHCRVSPGPLWEAALLWNPH